MRWQSALRLWPAVLVLVEIGSSWLLSNVLRTICGLSSRLVSTGKDRVPSAHERPAGRPPPEARHPDPGSGFEPESPLHATLPSGPWSRLTAPTSETPAPRAIVPGSCV